MKDCGIAAWWLLTIAVVSLVALGCSVDNRDNRTGLGLAPPERWTYTALGDSLAFGEGARPGGSYAAQYREHIQADVGVSVRLNNLGKRGWTSSELLKAIQTESRFRKKVAAAQVVTWNIGLNDFVQARLAYRRQTCGGNDNQDCLRTATVRFKANVEAIIVEILSLVERDRTIIRTFDLWHPHVGADKMLRSWDYGTDTNDFQVFQRYIREWNNNIEVTAGRHGIPLAGAYHLFNGEHGDEDLGHKPHMMVDPIHPNESGYMLVAELLRSLGYAPLR